MSHTSFTSSVTVQNITRAIQCLSDKMKDECSSEYSVQRARLSKHDLWTIKLAVDQALCDAPVFVDEPEYHEIYMMMKLKSEV